MALMAGEAGGSWAVTGVLAEEREPEGAGAEGLPDCVKRDMVVMQREERGGPRKGPRGSRMLVAWTGLRGGGLGKQPALGLHSRTCTHVCAQRVALSAHGSPSVTFDVTIQLAATASRGHQQEVLLPPGAPAVPTPGQHCVLRVPGQKQAGTSFSTLTAGTVSSVTPRVAHYH